MYILGVSEPISHFEGWIIGAVRRKDDCEDKLIAAPKGVMYHQAEIEEAVQFQEQYFDHYIIPLFHKSCGVIPYRMSGADREYLIVFEQFSKCWSLPKGHMESGETEQQTALRELKEETGLSAVLDCNSRVTIQYPLCPIGQKQVVLFLGKVSGIPKIRPGEIEKFRWVSKEMLSSFLHPDTWNACKSLL